MAGPRALVPRILRSRPLRAVAVLSVTALAAAAASAAELQIEVKVPAAMRVGEPARLEILLLDDQRRLVAAPRELPVVIHGGGRLLEGKEFRFPAGAEAIGIELEPEAPGTWAIEVVAEGLDPVWVGCAAVAGESATARGTADAWTLSSARALPQHVPENQPWSRADTRAGASAAPPRVTMVRPVRRTAGAERGVPRSLRREPSALETSPPPPPIEVHMAPAIAVPPAEAAPPTAEEEVPPPPPPPPAGGVRLVPPSADLRPQSDGSYRMQVMGFWYEGDQPALRAETLQFTLVADPALSELTVDPAAVELPAGGMSAGALLTSRSRGEVAVKAFYPGGVSEPARLRFLPPRPQRLQFVDVPTRLKSLGVAPLEVVVELLDESGRPTVTAEDLPVTVSAISDAGPRSATLTVPAGSGEGSTRVMLERFGDHRLSARGGGLEDAAGSVAMAFDLPVLLWALAGSLIGAGVALLRRRGKRRPAQRIAVDLALAVIAGAVILLLAAFGLLSTLAQSDPTGLWAGLAALPLSSQAAAFVLGFVAGFVGDKLWQLLGGALRGRKPAPAAK